MRKAPFVYGYAVYMTFDQQEDGLIRYQFTKKTAGYLCQLSGGTKMDL